MPPEVPAPSCWRSTRTASTGRLTPRTSGSPTPSASKTPGPNPNPVMREMRAASRHPEMPGQRQEAGRTVGVTAPSGPRRTPSPTGRLPWSGVWETTLAGSGTIERITVERESFLL